MRVTNVAGGMVETNFSKVRFKGDEEKANAVYSNVALGGPLNAEDIADCIMFALTRPPNVNIDEIVVMALAQTSGGNILRESPGRRRRPTLERAHVTGEQYRRGCEDGEHGAADQRRP